MLKKKVYLVWTFYSSSNSFEPVITVTPSKWKSILCDKESPESGKWKKINKYIPKTFARTQAFVIFPVMRKYWYNFFPKFTELDVVAPQRSTNIAVRNQQKCLFLGWHDLKKRRQFSNPKHSLLGPSRSFKCRVTQKVKN